MASLFFPLPRTGAPAAEPAPMVKITHVFDEHCAACNADGGDVDEPAELSLPVESSGKSVP